MDDLIRDMPKAEIHVHLEGAIQPEVVLQLAKQNDLLHTLPTTDIEQLKKWFVFTDFPHFVKIYVTISNLIRTAEDFSLIAYECGRDMAWQNIRYREATVTPYTHTHMQGKLPIEAVLEGLADGRSRAQQDFNTHIQWVFDVPRNFCFTDGQYNPEPANVTLQHAMKGRDTGVIGFGLGGYEVGCPPEPFAHAFEQAKAEGFLSVPHAGETVGPSSIWGSIHALGADRIGHGVRAIEDPELLTVLKEQQIPLEINPTSNHCLHVYDRLAVHPFPHLDKMGLFLTINSDDPPLFNTDLLQEYQVLVDEFGYETADLLRIARNAFVASAAPNKNELLAEFDAWVQVQNC